MPGGHKPDPKPPPKEAETALKMWNYMRGFDWNALDVLFEVHGVRDPEIDLNLLRVFRDFSQRG